MNQNEHEQLVTTRRINFILIVAILVIVGFAFSHGDRIHYSHGGIGHAIVTAGCTIAASILGLALVILNKK